MSTEPHHPGVELVVLLASAGDLEAVLGDLPEDFSAAVVVQQHWAENPGVVYNFTPIDATSGALSARRRDRRTGHGARVPAGHASGIDAGPFLPPAQDGVAYRVPLRRAVGIGGQLVWAPGAGCGVVGGRPGRGRRSKR